MHFREFLIEYENRLVSRHGVKRSPAISDKMRKTIASEDGADFIAALGVWIEEHPEAQEALREMGMSWSTGWIA